MEGYCTLSVALRIAGTQSAGVYEKSGESSVFRVGTHNQATGGSLAGIFSLSSVAEKFTFKNCLDTHREVACVRRAMAVTVESDCGQFSRTHHQVKRPFSSKRPTTSMMERMRLSCRHVRK